MMNQVTYTKVKAGTYKMEAEGKFVGTVEKSGNEWVIVGANGEKVGIWGKTRKEATTKYMDIIGTDIDTKGKDQHEHRVNIGSYYKMADGRIAYTHFHGQLVLTYTDGTSEAYSSDLMQVEIMQGKVVEQDRVVTIFTEEEQFKGVSHASGEAVIVLGKQVHKGNNGQWVYSYIYRIHGFKPENGKPFLALQDNITRL